MSQELSFAADLFRKELPVRFVSEQIPGQVSVFVESISGVVVRRKDGFLAHVSDAKKDIISGMGDQREISAIVPTVEEAARLVIETIRRLIQERKEES